MKLDPRRLFMAFDDAVRVRGGGLSGLRAVAIRGVKVLHALGWRGFVARLRGSMLAPRQAALPGAALVLPTPVPPEQIDLRVGVMAHVFYPDLIAEFRERIGMIPVPVVLMVSVVDTAAAAAAREAFSTLDNVERLVVRIVPNRGRDIAPFLVGFRDDILALDVVCHVHTKKSLYTGGDQAHWRDYLLDSLLGSGDRIGWILGTFQAMPELGIVYPESHESVSLAAHTWLSNKRPGTELAAALGLAIDPEGYLDFPAGSMFWARVAAIRPLLELGLSTASFPVEEGQTDGTLQHAIERLFVPVVRHGGFTAGILPVGHPQRMDAEGSRNWTGYFTQLPLEQRLVLRAIDADVVSFDLFDTLVTRPFLDPAGARRYLADVVAEQLGVLDFEALRERAESIARHKLARDPTLHEVYDELVIDGRTHGPNLDALREIELAVEKRSLRPRAAVLAGASRLAATGKQVFGLSDMYLGATDLARVLPPEVLATLTSIVVSCERGRRKDEVDSWSDLAASRGLAHDRWLHVGDNEHADLQVPRNAGLIEPVHVLRPRALLDVVPALRPLRGAATRSGWQDSLWTGLLANRFADMADRDSAAFAAGTMALATPADVGYCVLGPLVLDFLAWSVREAQAGHCSRLLFASREGYALLRAFEIFRHHASSLDGVQGTYLLTSRRAAGMAAARVPDELFSLLGGSFNGTLAGLLAARMGAPALAIARDRLGDAALARTVFLPEMLQEVVGSLQAVQEALLAQAADERDAYLDYWTQAVGRGPCAIVDLGYAGTIQARLSRLTGQGLTGLYFALSDRARNTDFHAGSAHARFHDGRAVMDDSDCAVLRNDLLLEALLTAPFGQLSHFEPSPGGVLPVYASEPPDPALHASIELVHRGIEDFINDVGTVIGDAITKLSFDPVLVQRPLECLGSGLWRMPTGFDGLAAEDRHSGRGQVPVA